MNTAVLNCRFGSIPAAQPLVGPGTKCQIWTTTIGLSKCLQWVTGGHAEQVAAAAGSPQKAALLAAGRDFGLGPRAVIGALLTSRSHQGLRPEGKEPFGVCAGNPDGG